MQVPSDASNILRAIRRIVRAVDLHSRKLRREAGLNVPQLLTLEAIGGAPKKPVLASAIAGDVGVSPGTMSGIVDRLVKQGLVDRERAHDDRRRVHLALSDAGRIRLEQAPDLLQVRLLNRLVELPPDEQAEILQVLEKVGRLMEAGGIDAAPILTTDAKLRPPESD